MILFFHGFVSLSDSDLQPDLFAVFPLLVACLTNSQMPPVLYQDQMLPVLERNTTVKTRLQIVHHYQERPSHYRH